MLAPGLLRGLRELRRREQPRVRVDLDDVRVALGVEADVDTAVVAKLESLVRGAGRLLQLAFCVVVEVVGEERLAVAIDRRAFLPLHLRAGDARRALG